MPGRDASASSQLPPTTKSWPASPASVCVDFLDTRQLTLPDTALHYFDVVGGYDAALVSDVDSCEDDDLMEFYNDLLLALTDDNSGPANFDAFVCCIQSTHLPDLSSSHSNAELLQVCCDSVDPGTRALNALDLWLHQMQHCIGGSMTNTTNHDDLLWHVTELTPANCHVALKVADDHAHYPQKVSFVSRPLMMPTAIAWFALSLYSHTPGNHHFTLCYGTPISLPHIVQLLFSGWQLLSSWPPSLSACLQGYSYPLTDGAWAFVYSTTHSPHL